MNPTMMAPRASLSPTDQPLDAQSSAFLPSPLDLSSQFLVLIELLITIGGVRLWLLPGCCWELLAFGPGEADGGKAKAVVANIRTENTMKQRITISSSEISSASAELKAADAKQRLQLEGEVFSCPDITPEMIDAGIDVYYKYLEDGHISELQKFMRDLFSAMSQTQSLSRE
jgi:hypothetical protein